MSRLLRAIGSSSARHPIAVIVAWIALVIVLGVTAAMGMKFSTGGFEIPGTESSEALKTVKTEFTSAGGSSKPQLQLVVSAPGGGKLTEPAHVSQLRELLSTLEGLPHVAAVSDPLDSGHPYISRDQTTAVSTVTFMKLTTEEAKAATSQVTHVASEARAEGYQADVGGTLANQVPEILGPSELVGAVIAFVVLLITFGSMRAAGANMLSALGGVAVGILSVLGVSLLSPIGSTTPILAVMLGLAVGIDYGLFVLARHRAALREGSPVSEAIRTAVGTAGTAVVFAGGTVIVALLGLIVVNIPFITEMGLAGAWGVFAAVAASVTLLPAVLSLMGRKVLPRRERGRVGVPPEESSPKRSSVFSGWARRVVKRPVLTLLSVVAVLCVASIPLLSMKTALATPGGERADSSQRHAYGLIADKFGAGAQSPLVVLAEGKNVAAAIPSLQEKLASFADVAAVVPSGVSANSDAALLTVIPKSGPVDAKTKSLVLEIRAHAPGDGVSWRVTGETAISIDTDARLSSALATYLLLVAGLSIILLVILFRSIIVPFAATLGYLFSLGAALGATTAVFQWGWLDSVFPAPQGNPLLSLLPILVVGILFGLAMDYQVFLVSRIAEAYRQGRSARDGIIEGFDHSAFVVVAAATIMFAVFGGFAFSESSFVASIALALAVGVAVDAFLVRMLFIPAILALAGKAAWWLPAWLERLLPRIDHEGSAELGAEVPVADEGRRLKESALQ